MGTGREIRDRLGGAEYIRRRLDSLAPAVEPVPFRGSSGPLEDPATFIDDLEEDLFTRPHAAWSVTGPPGFGKSLLGRWAAARWGRRFLEDPDGTPLPVLIGPKEMAEVLAVISNPPTLPLARKVLRASPDTLVRHLQFQPPFRDLEEAERRQIDPAETGHPFLLILDADEDPFLVPRLLPPGEPGDVRCLLLSLDSSRPGPSIRLAPWDRDSRLLAAHRARGDEGIRRLELVEGSLAASLASYPLYLGHLLERQAVDPAELRRDGGLHEFLRWIHGGGDEGKFLDWCEQLTEGPQRPLALQARKLHSRIAAGHSEEYHDMILAGLLAELIRGKRLKKGLSVRIYDEDEVDRTARLLSAGGCPPELPRKKVKDPVRASNLVNLRWKFRGIPGDHELLHARTIRVPSCRLPVLVGVDLVDSDLSGITLGRPLIRSCKFQGCKLDGADLRGTKIRTSELNLCSLDGADLTGATFLESSLEVLDFSRARMEGVRFHRCVLDRIRFGALPANEDLDLRGSAVRTCDFGEFEGSGLRLDSCPMSGCDLSQIELRRLEARKTCLDGCDLSGLFAPGARLEKADLENCLLGDVRLPGADLRGALLKGVEFRPGPGSRAGHTAPATRWHPMYGSQSGFYADDGELAAWGDPELVRVADLTGADLRGVKIEDTDLYRVDLRGARMDRKLRFLARSLGAFVD